MLKQFPSDKVNGTKSALFFLSRVPTHHSFTFNWRFLYELKNQVCFSKTLCGIFKLQQKVLKFNDIFVSWSSPKLAW